jgi:tetratricopeptide (TPR) repeat protein
MAKVRNAIHLPRISTQYTFKFVSPSSKTAVAAVTDAGPIAKTAELQKTLQGKPSDAAIYIDIALSYDSDAPGSAAKITDAFNHAVSLFRKQLDINPKDGWAMSQLGRALYNIHNVDESEKWLRLAVREAPNNWQCWANLGDSLQGIALAKTLGNNKTDAEDYTEVVGLLQSQVKKLGSDKALALLIAASEEARTAYDTAIKLAPNLAEAYDRRSTFRWIDHICTQAFLRAARGEAPETSTLVTDGTLADSWKAANLSPDATTLQIKAVMYELISQAHGLPVGQALDKQTALSKLPADRKEMVADAIARLTKSADSSVRATAVISLESLVQAYYLLGDTDDMARTAVRALTLDPDNQQIAQAVLVTYVAGARFGELAAVLEDQIKRHDNPYMRLCLVKTYDHLHKGPEAMEHIQEGIKLFPDDFLLNLALADQLMKDPGADSVKKAGDVISHAETIFDKLPAKDKQAYQSNFDVTHGVYLALIGKPDVARLALERVLATDPDNDDAKDVLGALGAK